MFFDRRLWRMTRGVRGRILWAVLLGLLSAAFGISRFVILGILLARVFAGASLSALLLPAAGVAAAVALRGFLEHRRAMVAHKTASLVQEHLRLALFDKIAALGPAWFARERTGAVALSLIDGVEQLESFFGRYLPQIAVAALTPIAIFAFIAFWDLPVAAVMLLFAFLTLLAPLAFVHRDRGGAQGRQNALKAFGAEFLDAIEGLPTLKAFGASAAFGERLALRARALCERTMEVLSLGVMTRGITDCGVAIGAACALGFGVSRVAHGAMSLEALLIVLMAGTEIFRPLRDLRQVLHQGLTGQAAAVGVGALLAAEPLLREGPARPGANRLSAPHPNPLPASGERKPAPAIAFENVRFAYPGPWTGGGRGNALDDLSFRLAPGEKIGIVGPSGAGKSTITRLLLRLFDPQEGRVTIGGEDVKNLDPDLLRATIAIVHQDTMLFYGTVEENLRLGKPEASRAEIEAAARDAHAAEFIARLPQGYATLIGERGVRLSGGERQRLAIARALLKDAPILILDEALSSVDAESEAAIERALDRLSAGRTTLVLAHRLSSVIGADRILVLDSGRLVEAGRHAELIRQDGAYRRLMGTQAEAPEEGFAFAGEDAGEDAGGRAATTREPGTPAGESAPEALAEKAARIGSAATLASLLAVIRPWSRRFSLVVGAGTLRVAAMIGVGILSAFAVAAIKSGSPFRALLLALALVAPLAGLFHWLESWLAHDIAYRLLTEMRIALFRKLDALAPAYLLRRRSGDLVALANDDIETIEYFFAHTVAPALVAVFVPLAVLATLAVLAWPTALALFPFVLYAGLGPVLLRARIDREGARAREALGSLSAQVTETIEGLTDLLAYQAIGRRRQAFREGLRAYGRVRLSLLADLSRQGALLETVSGLGGLAVAVVGARLAAAHAMSPTLLPVLILMALASFLPISEIAQVSRQLADTIGATRRLSVVHRERPAVSDGAGKAALRSPRSATGSAIAFERVFFTYPGEGEPALRDIVLDIPAGARVALVGPSGAGKTTLAHLLLRFFDPASGRILLDGIDLREFALDDLRRRIALVSQDTYLFNDTLEANVALAAPGASEHAVRRALEEASLGEFLASLPEGLDTLVGERGVQLSGGQRQRVAIARAFLKNAPTLVLDEATSHLDAVSEAQVKEALSRLMRERTTILIAHRLSTVRDADRIAVVAEGRIVETGKHGELLAQGGLYARLVRRQLAAAQGRLEAVAD